MEIKNALDMGKTTKTPPLIKLVSPAQWLLFFGSVGMLVLHLTTHQVWNIKDLFQINGFTILIWIAVTLFGAIVSSYSRNYLNGFKYHQRFSLLSLGFTLSVMVFVMANHVALFLFFWLVMGLIMARLIGINSDWGEAREALKLAQKYFVSGAVLLSIGVLTLSFYHNIFTIGNLIDSIGKTPRYIVLISAFCIIAAALIQSAIYPFHRWLLSAMTAPTPASALMHAGFVNGSGILLSILSAVLIASNTLTLVFIIGGLTAIIAQFTKLLQVNIKQKLACSTIAQMGFMIMQCGLGFFNAAVVHLILHGFYKAYLFLSSGEEIAQTTPNKPNQINIKPLQALAVLLYGCAGALLFGWLTGKTNFNDSSVFLILIVAIAVGQVTFNIVKEKSLSYVQRTILPALLFTAGIAVYALFYNGVTLLISDMPFILTPQPLSVLQLVFGVVFLLGFFIMKLGLYKKIPWLYVKLLNLSLPNKRTVLIYKVSKK